MQKVLLDIQRAKKKPTLKLIVIWDTWVSKSLIHAFRTTTTAKKKCKICDFFCEWVEVDVNLVSIRWLECRSLVGSFALQRNFYIFMVVASGYKEVSILLLSDLTHAMYQLGLTRLVWDNFAEWIQNKSIPHAFNLCCCLIIY